MRSGLEYCSTVWNPHVKEQRYRLEMVQRRAARFATNRFNNTSSVSDMLQDLQWETLESRCIKKQICMMYRINNNLVDIPAEEYLTTPKRSTRSNHSFKFLQYPTSTDCFKYSFFPRTIPVWNTLPAALAEAPSLASFKRELKSQTF